MENNVCLPKIYQALCWSVICLTLSFPATSQTKDSSTPELVLRLNHIDSSLPFSFSSDGKLLATLGRNWAIYLWDVNAGELKQKVSQLPGSSLRSLIQDARIDAQPPIFSPDGKYLAYCSVGVPALVREIATGKNLPVPEVRQFSICQFTEDGRTIAGFDKTGKAVLWEARTGAVKTSFQAHPGLVFNAVFTAAGRQLVTVSRVDDTVKVWNWNTKTVVRSFKLEQFGGIKWQLSPDGRWMAVVEQGAYVQNGQAVKIWDTQNWQLKRQLKGHALVMVFSPDNEFLATHNYDGGPNILNLATGTIKKLDLGITQAEKERVHQELLAGKKNVPSPYLDWDAIYGKPPGEQLNSFAFTADSRFFRALRTDGKLSVWDARTGARMKPVVEAHQGKESLANLERTLSKKRRPSNTGFISRQKLWVNFTTWGKTIEQQLFQFKFQSQFTLEEDSMNEPPISQLSPDKQLALRFSSDLHSAEVNEVSTSKLLHKLEEKEGLFIQGQFSTDGKLLATTSLTPQGLSALEKERQEFEKQQTAATALTNPTARQEGGQKNENAAPATTKKIPLNEDKEFWDNLMPMRGLKNYAEWLMAEGDEIIKMWDVQTGQLLKVLQNYRGVVNEMRFSPNGQSLTVFHSITKESTAMRVWDWRQGRFRQEMPGTNNDARFLVSSDRSTALSNESASCDNECHQALAEKMNQLKATGKTAEAEALYRKATSQNISAWDLVQGKLLWTAPLDQFGVEDLTKLRLSPDGKYFGRFSEGITNRKGEFSLWETATGKQSYRQAVELNTIFNYAGSTFSPTGRYFSFWSSGQFFVWDMKAAKMSAMWNLDYEHAATYESFSEDDRVFATIGIDDAIQVRNPANGQLLVTLAFIGPAAATGKQKQMPEWIAYTPGGYYCGSPSIEQYIRWQVGGRYSRAQITPAPIAAPILSEKRCWVLNNVPNDNMTLAAPAAS